MSRPVATADGVGDFEVFGEIGLHLALEAE
jgi:hypothetical protein